MQVVAWTFLVGKSTVSGIILEVCGVIWKVLQHLYVKTPVEHDWLNIAEDFDNKWNLKNCVGALDGKHISIQAPRKSGTQYFNYKKFYSIVLLATCDANYKFTLVDIGAFGSVSDGAVFMDCQFGEAMVNGTLGIPKDRTIPEMRRKVPFFFAGDAAFPLKSYIMRPYPGLGLNKKERVFNYRLSRARRTIENSFGILVSRWRIFRQPIIADVPTIELMVAGTICLHNFIMTEEAKSPNSSLYTPRNNTENFSRELNESVLNPIGRIGPNRSADSSRELRDNLASFYISPAGEILSQYKYVNRGEMDFK